MIKDGQNLLFELQKETIQVKSEGQSLMSCMADVGFVVESSRIKDAIVKEDNRQLDGRQLTVLVFECCDNN